MSLKRPVFTVLLIAVLVCCGTLIAAAQDGNKELVDTQDPFILNPPTTSLDTANAVNLPPANTALDTTPQRAEVTAVADTEAPAEGGSAVRTEKPERPTPKNVTRIDNDPKRKRSVQPMAVIKAQLSPWGYTNRYLEGDIAEPEHPFGQATSGPGGIGNNQNRPGLSLSGGFGGSGSKRDDEDSNQ